MSGRFTSLHEAPGTLEAHGQKATLLSRAASQGERVPAGVVLSAGEAAALVAGDATLEATLEASLAWLSAGGALHMAVRSSPTLSLPGALLTRLDVPCEREAVRAALAEVVASTRSAAALDQLRARGLAVPEAAWCGVIVQRYVPASAASVGLVACTHDPTSGEPGLFGEYVAHAGAQAVVSGRSRPSPLSCAAARAGAEQSALERTNPALYAELGTLVARLEAAFDEPLELELAHEGGLTWLLQVRPLVLSPRAQARVALAAIEADSPRYAELLRRLIADGLPRLVEERLPPPERLAGSRPLARGLAASPGVGSGVLVIDLASALERARSEPVILARRDAVPEDVAAFRASRGVITTSGGLTSHAAVIARGLRVPAVVGASQLRVDARQRCLLDASGAVIAREGDVVTLDAHRGLLYAGAIPVEPALAAPELGQLLVEARKLRRVPVWVRAPHAQAVALRAAFVLDGALALLGPGELPGSSAETPLKDIWVEVDAGAALELAPKLPPGHGMVVHGSVDDALVRALRNVSRILAVGVHASAAPRLTERIDLVVCGSADDVSELSVSFPKIVRVVDSAVDFLQAGHESGAILACEPTQALRFALGLAAVGRPGWQSRP